MNIIQDTLKWNKKLIYLKEIKNPDTNTKIELSTIEDAINVRLWHSIQANDFSTLKELVKKGVNIDSKDDDGNSILHKISQSQKDESIKMKKLLNMGANINTINTNNITPLMDSIRTKYNFKFLVENKADINLIPGKINNENIIEYIQDIIYRSNQRNIFSKLYIGNVRENLDFVVHFIQKEQLSKQHNKKITKKIDNIL